MKYNVRGMQTTRTYEIDVTDVEPITKTRAETIKYLPDTVTVTVTDGKVTTVQISGPRVLKSGEFSDRQSERFGTWSLRHLPEWALEITERIAA